MFNVFHPVDFLYMYKQDAVRVAYCISFNLCISSF